MIFPIYGNVISQTKIYINYVTHNEDNYDRYVTDQAFYYDARAMLRQFAIDCKMKGAKWSMGNDFQMLDAVVMHDVPPVTATTDGLNLLKWFQDSMDVELDPHAHAQPANPSLADVAYKHTLLGVTPSSVISGYLIAQPDDHNVWWSDYENPVASDIDPSYTFHPEILWGGATQGHSNDPLYHGIWKPKDTLNYLVHEPSNRLINYGNGCRIKITDNTTIEEVLTAVDSVILQVQNGDYPSDGFYQISIFMAEFLFWDSIVVPPHTYAFNGDFLNKLNTITDSLNVRVNQNTLEWMHIEDIVNEWKTTYNSTGFFVSCDGDEFLGSSEDKEITFGVFPNPTSDRLAITPGNLNDIYSITLYDINGKIIRQQAHLHGDYLLRLGDVKPGLYILHFETSEGFSTSKIIVE
jgi:hypothetical protein